MDLHKTLEENRILRDKHNPPYRGPSVILRINDPSFTINHNTLMNYWKGGFVQAHIYGNIDTVPQLFFGGRPSLKDQLHFVGFFSEGYGSSYYQQKRGSPALKKCQKIMCHNKIYNKKDFLNWARKGHPDHGGDTEVFQEIHQCVSKEDYCGS